MSSLKRHEGYLLIDNRGLPGIDRNVAKGIDPLGANQTYETATITCAHCQVIVILRPDRSRPRGYCPKCDKYVCDRCDGKGCFDINRLLDTLQEQYFRDEQRSK